MKSMKITIRALVAAFVLFPIVFGTTAFAKEGPKDKKGKNNSDNLSKIAAYQPDRYQILNINNLWAWHREDGQANHSPTGDNGTFFPRGTSFVIYQDGLVWGSRAYLDPDHTQPAPFAQTIRVGGATYSTGTFEGWVIGSGATAQEVDREDPRARIYRVRRDWQDMTTADLERDAAESNEIGVSSVTSTMVQQIIEEYAWSWNNWPVDLNAPYIDRNGNGMYDPPPSNFATKDLIEMQYDEPGIAGADPDSPADQVIWTVFHDLDRARSTGRFGSEPTGLEIQMTMWAYKRTDALGNIFFRKWTFINKGGVDIDEAGTRGSFYLDSMYVCQWSDPDLGSFSDDLVGTDIEKSLGYVYNGNAVDTDFRKFNLPPPSGGYDFLQGPAVPDPGGSGIFNLKVKADIKNLGMTGFSYFSAGSPYTDPGPAGVYDTNAIYWYKMLRGFAPLGGPDQRYAHPPGVEEGPFPLSGDPVAGTGHIDGQGENWSFVPGDRRLLIITGPFQMAPGDTQEVVVAFVAGIGSDRLSSVAVMKFNDRFAQNTYDALFQVPSAPAAPDVIVSELDGQVILQWGSNLDTVDDTENKVNQPGNFVFEGYNVYMLPSATATPAEGKLIATFDQLSDPSTVLDERFDLASGQILNTPVHFGSNSGLSRFYSLDRDELFDLDQLNNGQEYYIAVTSYSVSTIPGYLPASLESEFKIIGVVPESRQLGQTYGSELGSAMTVTHVSGSGNAQVIATVIDPNVIIPATYDVEFDADLTWKLSRGGTVLLSGQTNFAVDEDYLIADGILVKVGDLVFDAPATFFNEGTTVDADPSDGDIVLWGDSQVFGADTGLWLEFGGGTAVPDATVLQRDLEFRFTGLTAAGDDNNDAPIASGGQWGTQWPRGSFGEADLSSFDHVQVRLPFELWDVENDRQVNVAVIVRNADGNAPFGNDQAPTPAEAIWRMPGRDYILVVMTDYPGDAAAENTVVSHIDPSVSWLLFFLQSGDSVWSGGDVFLLQYSNPIIPGSDKFSFSSAGFESTIDNATAQQEVSRIGVFPNPYYAFNPQEINKLSRFITFNNLPGQATIRIFNLAGQLVRTIEHSGGQFQRWDLLNFSNLPVASGMYIAHIEMDNIGVRILKLAVIQEGEILETF